MIFIHTHISIFLPYSFIHWKIPWRNYIETKFNILPLFYSLHLSPSSFIDTIKSLGDILWLTKLNKKKRYFYESHFLPEDLLKRITSFENLYLKSIRTHSQHVITSNVVWIPVKISVTFQIPEIHKCMHISK